MNIYDTYPARRSGSGITVSVHDITEEEAN